MAGSPSRRPVALVQGRGFEHPEESCWRTGATTIDFASETYGDADIIEIDASGLPDAQLSIEGTIGEYQKMAIHARIAPSCIGPHSSGMSRGQSCSRQVSLRRDLGGEGLFLALERLTDAPLPLEISGSIDVDARNGPHGFRPVYISARQIDDEKVWTSPLFIRFPN